MQKTIPVKMQGNRRFVLQPLNDTKTAYTDEAVNIIGLVDLSGSFTIEETSFPADDDPEFMVATGAPIGTLTGNMRGFDIEKYPLIYPAMSGTNGVWVGGDLPVRRFGFTFDEQVEEEGVKSVNRYVLFNCRATNLPDIASATISNSVTEPRVIPLAITVMPIFYDRADGSRGRLIYAIFNSVKHPTMFAQFADGLVMPTESMVEPV